jgi:hypothetical protein
MEHLVHKNTPGRRTEPALGQVVTLFGEIKVYDGIEG